MAATEDGCGARIIVLPFPAQGHVMPFMELSRRLAGYGFCITFVNTEYNHKRLLASTAGGEVEGIDMVALPDGLAPEEDRRDIAKLVEGMYAVTAGRLEDLITEEGRRKEPGRPFKWLITDVGMGWSVSVAKKASLRVAVFPTFSASLMAVRFLAAKMVEEGIIDDNGFPTRHQVLMLSPKMPSIDTNDFPWNNCGAPEKRSFLFRHTIIANQALELAEAVIFNSFYELESEAFGCFINHALPLGPLLPKSIGNFWKEDANCMAWLDEQPQNSVVYVAFGSLATMKGEQIRELADGLVQMGRPFLWVARPDMSSDGLPLLDECKRKADGHGMITCWAPQLQVLAHPAVACFVSHCGWNSTLEGMANGVPFLCWPYFADQLFNQSCICNFWKIGMRVTANERGIVSAEQIKGKLKMLLQDDSIKAAATTLKNAACSSIMEGGSSHQNFIKLVNLMRN